MDELGADVAEAKASHLLHGLGFTKQMMTKKCKDFSGNNSTSFIVGDFFKIRVLNIWLKPVSPNLIVVVLHRLSLL